MTKFSSLALLFLVANWTSSESITHAIHISTLKEAKVVDSLEKEQQPEDNDDDEKLSDNHNKMSKINIKNEEIKKLVKQHNSLT